MNLHFVLLYIIFEKRITSGSKLIHIRSSLINLFSLDFDDPIPFLFLVSSLQKSQNRNNFSLLNLSRISDSNCGKFSKTSSLSFEFVNLSTKTLSHSCRHNLIKKTSGFIFPTEDAENDFLSGLKDAFEDSGKFSHIENIMGFGRWGVTWCFNCFSLYFIILQ